MTYIVYFDRDKILEDRIGMKEMRNYSHLSAFLPLLEKRGKVIVVEDQWQQVDGVHQFAQYLGEQALFLSFTPPDEYYKDIKCPKLFISSIIRAGKKYHAGAIQVKSIPMLKEGIQQSLAGVAHCAFANNLLHELVEGSIPTFSIPPPIWDRFSALQASVSEDQPAIVLPTNGNIIDTQLPKLRPPFKTYSISLNRRLVGFSMVFKRLEKLPSVLAYLIQRPSRHYYQTDLSFSGTVYTAVIRSGNPFKNWKRLIRVFCDTFQKEAKAILVIKMAGRVHEYTRRSVPTILRRRAKSLKCRIVLINEHLPLAVYQDLVRTTTYIINPSTSAEMSNSLMEFMSAGKPAISVKQPNMGMIHEKNAFLLPTEALQDSSLSTQLKQSFKCHQEEPAGYRAMAQSASQAMQSYCSVKVVEPVFFELLDKVEQGLLSV